MERESSESPSESNASPSGSSRIESRERESNGAAPAPTPAATPDPASPRPKKSLEELRRAFRAMNEWEDRHPLVVEPGEAVKLCAEMHALMMSLNPEGVRDARVSRDFEGIRRLNRILAAADRRAKELGL